MLGCYRETFAVPAADRHRGSCARAAEPRGRFRGFRRGAEPAQPARIAAAAEFRGRPARLEGVVVARSGGGDAARRSNPHGAGRATSKEQRADALAHCRVAGRDGGRVAHQQRPDPAHPRDAVGAARACRPQSVGARGRRAAVRCGAGGDVGRRRARRLAGVADVPARRAVRRAGAAIHRGSAGEMCASDAPREFISTMDE